MAPLIFNYWASLIADDSDGSLEHTIHPETTVL